MNRDIIIPPTEIRSVIDKTAEFVAKMGDEFEKKVIAQQGKEKKFSFLLTGSPYRKYYDNRVREILEGKQASAQVIPKALMDYKLQMQSKQDKLMIRDVPDVEYPQPNPDIFTVPCPSITSLDADIIKTTAQFVARNGEVFLRGLISRESRNPQFDFLKESNPLFAVFTNLVDAYTRCILLSQDVRAKLDEGSGNILGCVQSCAPRYDFEAQERNRMKKRAKREAETREGFDSIDWNDFVVVATITFEPGTRFIPPVKPGQFILPPTSVPQFDVAEEEMNMDEEVTRGHEPQGVKIVTDYVRKRTLVSEAKTVVCPITGQQVEADKFSDHLRVVLLDPQWKKQKELLLGRAKLTEPNVDIAASLADFVSKRPDIFGVTDRQESIDSNVTPIGPSMPPAPPSKKSKSS